MSKRVVVRTQLQYTDLTYATQRLDIQKGRVSIHAPPYIKPSAC